MSYSSVETVHIRKLCVPCQLGIHPSERRHDQIIFIDLTMPIIIEGVADKDDIVGVSLNYESVVHQLTDWVKQTNFHLLETLVKQMADWLHQSFNLTWLRLQITKPKAIEEAEGVSVVLERHYTSKVISSNPAMA